jgi:hypothetical protein
VRLVPEQFSWVDQALVQWGLIDRLDARSAALYLFLVTVVSGCIDARKYGGVVQADAKAWGLWGPMLIQRG